MIDRMVKRLPTQKLLCDVGENIVIPHVFESVENMPNALQHTRHGIIKGDPMFLYLNGHPIPIRPQYIYNVSLQGNDLAQIKIKLIAPG